MFLLTLILLMGGFKVAFVFGGVALLFALISEELGLEVWRCCHIEYMELWEYNADVYSSIYSNGVNLRKVQNC